MSPILLVRVVEEVEEVEVAVAECGNPGQCGQAGEESLAGSPILTSSQQTQASHHQPSQLIVRQ